MKVFRHCAFAVSVLLLLSGTPFAAWAEPGAPASGIHIQSAATANSTAVKSGISGSSGQAGRGLTWSLTKPQPNYTIHANTMHQFKEPSTWNPGIVELVVLISAFWVSLLLIVVYRLRRWQEPVPETHQGIVPQDRISAPAGGRSSSRGEKYLARLRDQAEQMDIIRPPRMLLKNPFSEDHKGLTFEERVQIAAERSLRHDRVLGVIRFSLDVVSSSDGGNAAVVKLSADATAEVLRGKLRSGDYVRLEADGGVSIFLPLIHTSGDLKRVAARLFGEIWTRAEGLGLQPLNLPGTAMYPIDGYSAESLLESAQNKITPISNGITIQPGDCGLPFYGKAAQD